MPFMRAPNCATGPLGGSNHSFYRSACRPSTANALAVGSPAQRCDAGRTLSPRSRRRARRLIELQEIPARVRADGDRDGTGARRLLREHDAEPLQPLILPIEI